MQFYGIPFHTTICQNVFLIKNIVTSTRLNLKVSHPRYVVWMQVREEDPIRVQSQNTTKC